MTATTAPGLTRPSTNGTSSAPRPVPPIRQRNLARIAIGTLVLVISTLGVVAITSHANATHQVVVVRHNVAAGQPIRSGDLGAISVAANLPVTTVSASTLDRVVGQHATSTLVRGTLLSPDQIDTSPDTAGTAVVGATLAAGQYPSTLQVGDRVLIIATDTADSGTATASPEPIRGIVVDLVPGSTQSEPTIAALRVAVGQAPQIAAAGAGHLSLVAVGP